MVADRLIQKAMKDNWRTLPSDQLLFTMDSLNESMPVEELKESFSLKLSKSLSLMQSQEEEPFNDSLIIKKLSERRRIRDILPGKPKSTVLLYSAKRDGHHPSIFHEKCDGKGRTVVFYLSQAKVVCCGYTSVPWNKEGDYVADPEAFVFAQSNPGKVFRPNDKD